MTGNLFKITPIGLIYEENGRITAEVNGNLCKGLKYISLFSHIILLYRSETQPNILNTNLSQRVVKLEEVREKEGKLIIGSLSGMEVTRNLLYDIKPYFPNEDRVKNAMAPSRPFQSFPSLCKDSLTRLERYGNSRAAVSSKYRKILKPGATLSGAFPISVSYGGFINLKKNASEILWNVTRLMKMLRKQVSLLLVLLSDLILLP